MPPLLCLSPQLLDQSFPRSDIELHVVADVLADLDGLRMAEIAHLALPDTLASYVEEICWSRPNPQGRLLDVHRYLVALFAQPASGVVRVDVECVADAPPHPIPAGCQMEGWADEWAEEVGRLLRRHDRSLPGNGFFIGLFVGSSGATSASYAYDSHQRPTDRSFPLVDAGTLDDLEDAYASDVPAHYADRTVKLRDVLRNYRALGAIALERPSGDDHYHVVFPGGKKLTFAQNWTEIGENVISELRGLTKWSSAEVKYALCEGKNPKATLKPRLRLMMCSGCDPCPRKAKSRRRRGGK